MHYTINEGTVTITCTFEDLTTMEALGQALYATPTPDGEANQVYLASRPQWRDDFVLATDQDFDDAEGLEITAGWQEMDDAALAEHAADTYTITVPRRRPGDEA